ncbi:MAG: patatin-like phospholipase family protein, partial [Leptothrix sp. (in: b-proteobacteria)]
MPRYRTFEEHMDAAVGPKRMLALDGGGLRGMLTVGLLRKLEQTLRQRFDDPGMRLCDYFDLIGGTSTGAIIAAGLSLGMTVDDVEAQYRKLGHKVFKKSFWRRGIVNSAYDAGAVADALQDVFGSRTLASTDFRTGLMVLSKRYDTGSAWPLTNNRAAKY